MMFHRLIWTNFFYPMLTICLYHEFLSQHTCRFDTTFLEIRWFWTTADNHAQTKYYEIWTVHRKNIIIQHAKLQINILKLNTTFWHCKNIVITFWTHFLHIFAILLPIKPNIYTDQWEPIIIYYSFTYRVIIQLCPRCWYLDSNYCLTRCRQSQLGFVLSQLLLHLRLLGTFQSDIPHFMLTRPAKHIPNQGWESTHRLHLYPLGSVFYPPHRALAGRDVDFTSHPKE